MPKRTRIYTRTGDDGTTGLIGGARIEKSAPRIEAYGSVDELSSAIGVVRAELLRLRERSPRAVRLDAWLSWVQDVLFNVGSRLATPPERPGDAAVTARNEDAALERAIDEAEAGLPPLDAFILPSGSLAGAQLHVARTTCRRAERRVVALSKIETVAPAEARFLNRLSDALFVWSRWINHELEQPEHRWNPDAAPPPPLSS